MGTVTRLKAWPKDGQAAAAVETTPRPAPAAGAKKASAKKAGGKKGGQARAKKAKG